MSKIAILTDSSCDIPQELAEKYGIDIMSFHILLDDVDYIERESCTNEEFYEKMRAAKGIPSTAAITPIQFCEKYCQYVDEGYTDVIHVPINRSGSSTYNNAVMAQGMLREERPEHHLRIHLLDPHTYSMPFGWYVCEMARKLQNGAEISHVIQEFETQMDKMEIVLGPYSLKQMKKSGRISAAAAVMGELMGRMPIKSPTTAAAAETRPDFFICFKLYAARQISTRASLSCISRRQASSGSPARTLRAHSHRYQPYGME